MEQMLAEDFADYLPAKRAMELLDVKPQTLYAYVARGWIRAVSQAGTRQKLYSRDDIEKIRMRSMARAGHAAAAASAMRWGEPVIRSSITEITPQGPRYRGRLATDIARAGYPFEATANLLWTGIWDEASASWKFDPPPADFHVLADDLVRRFPHLPFRQTLALLVQLLSAAQGGNPELTLGATIPAARQLIYVLAGAFGYLRGGKYVPPRRGESIASLLARALRVRVDAKGEASMNAALTISADHELAPSTFAARIAASTGADLHASILSGIAAFNGALTGRGTDRTEELVRGAATKAELRKRLQLQQQRGKEIPGFNHPLYPKGDPRAHYLLDSVSRMQRVSGQGRLLAEFIKETEKDLHVYPSLPVGLVALRLALGLPERASGALFLLGRVAGWIAHIQEQRLAGYLLRPRAKYIP